LIKKVHSDEEKSKFDCAVYTANAMSDCYYYQSLHSIGSGVVYLKSTAAMGKFNGGCHSYTDYAIYKES